MSGDSAENSRKYTDFQREFNPEPPAVMWIDLNSAFATTEQQAHISLRGRPVGIANRVSRNCCIITASYEARAAGVKTGMRREEALKLCPDLVILESDPPKYRFVHEKLFAIMNDFSPKCEMKSIDEGTLDFHHLPEKNREQKLREIGAEIKARVRVEIGDYMTINVGIGPNRFLAKMAAGLHKPNGLDVLDRENTQEIFANLKLEDLTGIAKGYGKRLRENGIFTPADFLAAREETLKNRVFRGIVGTYWWRRLRGYEIDDYKSQLSMVGRQWVVGLPTSDEEYLRSCLHYLTETVAMKLRFKGQAARGACVWLGFAAGDGWHEKKLYTEPCHTNDEIWRRVSEIFANRPAGKVKIMGIYLYKFEPAKEQISFLQEKIRAERYTLAIDQVNGKYGIFTAHSAESLTGKKNIKQKIPFGGGSTTDYFQLLLGR